MFRTLIGRITFTVLCISLIPLIIAAYGGASDARDLLYLQREQELLAVAAQLNGELTSFRQLLAAGGAAEAGEDRQTAVLNDCLQPVVMRIARQYPGVGLGYYSRQLDRNVAVGPVADPSFLRKVEAPGAFAVYETGKFAVLRVDNSILWDGKPILAVHFPVKRDGEIIGHTFANAKIEDIEAAFGRAFVKRLAVTGLAWLLLAGAILLSFRHIQKGLDILVQSIKTENDEPPDIKNFPEIRPVLASVIALRNRIRDDNKSLNEANSKLSRLIDLCPAAILELDEHGVIVNLNQAMLNFYHDFLPYDRNGIVGRKIGDIAAELGLPFEQSFIFRILNGQEITNQYFERLGRYWILSGIPVRDPETGAVKGALAIYNDITHYETIKSEMARLESLNAIGATASSVAHELRNPATTIKGFLQLLSKKSPPGHKEYFAIVLEELDRMNDIIENFLSLARDRRAEKAASDINQLLHSLQPLLQSDALKNGIDLKYDLGDNLRTLEVNVREIRQLVLNLARNAIEAMPPKGRLTVATRNVLGGVEIAVSDTGTGIAAEALPHIFQPFYTSKKNGTGLGLSVCNNIVQAHGGTISVKSAPGQGTTFTIYLPI